MKTKKDNYKVMLQYTNYDGAMFPQTIPQTIKELITDLMKWERKEKIKKIMKTK